MERRQLPKVAPFDAAELDWINPWRFVNDADRARIDAWGGDAFDPRRRGSDCDAPANTNDRQTGGQ